MASLVPGYASMQISAEFIVPNIGARTTRERPNPSLAQNRAEFMHSCHIKSPLVR